MSQNYGTLVRRVGQKDGKEQIVFMGLLNAVGIITGNCCVMPKKKTHGNEWPLEVKIKHGGAWASLGSAKWERKNAQSSWYLQIAIESPLIQKILGDVLWLKAFAKTEDKGDKPGGAEEYDMIWSAGGPSKPKSIGAELDDEIPFDA